MARERRSARRRSRLGWVRAEPSRTLHAILGRFGHDRTTQNLTQRQEWLWDQIVAELRWRRLAERDWSRRCYCMFCMDPDPWDEDFEDSY